MRNDELSIQSMDFAVQIINLVKDLKSKHENKESVIPTNRDLRRGKYGRL